MKKQTKRLLIASIAVVIGVAVWSALPGRSYISVMPELHYGMAANDVMTTLSKAGVPCKRSDKAITAGKLTWQNLFREENQLILCIEGEKLSLAYEDRIRRFDDFGSRDVKIGVEALASRRLATHLF